MHSRNHLREHTRTVDEPRPLSMAARLTMALKATHWGPRSSLKMQTRDPFRPLPAASWYNHWRLSSDTKPLLGRKSAFCVCACHMQNRFQRVDVCSVFCVCRHNFFFNPSIKLSIIKAQDKNTFIFYDFKTTFKLFLLCTFTFPDVKASYLSALLWWEWERLGSYPCIVLVFLPKV